MQTDQRPGRPDLLLALTRAQINAGNQLAEVEPETGEAALTAGSAPAARAGERNLVRLPGGDRRTERRRALVVPTGAVHPGRNLAHRRRKPKPTSKPRPKRSRSSPNSARASNSLSTLAIYTLFTVRLRRRPKKPQRKRKT